MCKGYENFLKEFQEEFFGYGKYFSVLWENI